MKDLSIKINISVLWAIVHARILQTLAIGSWPHIWLSSKPSELLAIHTETRPKVKHTIPDTMRTRNYTTNWMTRELKWKRVELAFLSFKLRYMADLGTGPCPPQMRPSRMKMRRETRNTHRTRGTGDESGLWKLRSHLGSWQQFL